MMFSTLVIPLDIYLYADDSTLFTNINPSNVSLNFKISNDQKCMSGEP